MLLAEGVELVGNELRFVEHIHGVADKFVETDGVFEHGEQKRRAAEWRVGFQPCGKLARDRRGAVVGGGVFEIGEFAEEYLFYAAPFPSFKKYVSRGADGKRADERQSLARYKIIRLDLFHLVAEKIDAGGIFAVDRKNIQNVAAQGERALGLHRRGADIPHIDQAGGEGGKILFLPFPQFQNGKLFRKELHEALNIRNDAPRAAGDLI